MGFNGNGRVLTVRLALEGGKTFVASPAAKR